MSKRILFVESSCVGAAYSAEAAIDLGYSPVFLTDLVASQGDTRKQMSRYDCVECDTRSVDAILAAIEEARLDGIHFVTSFNDSYLMNAVALARRMNVGGLCPAVERLKDKGEVYALVPDFSPRSLLFSSDDIPFDAIKELLDSSGAVIVKARRSSGGLGTLTLRSGEEVNRLPRRLSESGIPDHLSPDLWLAQEFTDGELVSLEGYVIDGAVKFLGFSGRKKIGMSESVIMFPWDENLSPEAINEAKRALVELVNRSGFNNNYFHVEFMMKGSRAFLIDANMGRIGGGGLSEQVAIAYGISPRTLHVHMLTLSVEGKDMAGHETFKAAPRRTASALYGIPVQAQLKSVQLPDSFSCFHTQILDAGEIVPAMGTSNYAWIGIVSGDIDRAMEETAKIKINTSEGEFAAIF
jgi:biotin carboxylase